jgi:hypothetical protein
MPKAVILKSKKMLSLYIKTFVMNWILLIIAGFFEVGFATCLGKAKETS